MLPASRKLRSKSGKEALFIDILKLGIADYHGYYNRERLRPLLDAILSKQPDEAIWDAVYESLPPFRISSSSISSVANSTDDQ
jgi:hypothetical protein